MAFQCSRMLNYYFNLGDEIRDARFRLALTRDHCRVLNDYKNVDFIKCPQVAELEKKVKDLEETREIIFSRYKKFCT